MLDKQRQAQHRGVSNTALQSPDMLLWPHEKPCFSAVGSKCIQPMLSFPFLSFNMPDLSKSESVACIENVTQLDNVGHTLQTSY